MKLWTLIGLICLISCALLSTKALAQESNEGNSSGGGGGGSGSGSILDMFLSPFRSTIDGARRIFGHRLGNVRDVVNSGYDKVQMQAFKMFANLYNKTYSAEELPRRMALFFERRKQIDQWAREFVEGRVPFLMRENSFVDWDEKELKALTGVSPPRSFSELTPDERKAVIEQRHEMEKEQAALWPSNEPTTSDNVTRRSRRSTKDDDDDDDDDVIDDEDKYFLDENSVEDDGDNLNITVKQTERIPASKDWRSSGCVGTPINQLKCGACYAIATMGVVETMRCLNQVSSPSLSPQQVVDCATSRAGYQNFGCDGGWPTRVLKYLQNVGIAARESCYPFVRRQMTCRLNRVSSISGCTVKASPTDTTLRYKVLNNERDIQYHVAKTGPVVTVMKATDKFLYYGSGIFDDPKCSRKRDDVDHAIVIVGYGRENNQDYWLIKNSWGTDDWGQGGYGKYKRGTNACSIGHWGWVVTS